MDEIWSKRFVKSLDIQDKFTGEKFLIQRKFKQYEVVEVGEWAKQMYKQISQAKKEKNILEKTIRSKVKSTVKKRL